MAAQVEANMAAACAVVYFFKTLLIILTVRYLPQAFGIDPVAAARSRSRSRRRRWAVRVRPLRVSRVKEEAAIGKPPSLLHWAFGTIAVRLIRGNRLVAISDAATLARGDEVTATEPAGEGGVPARLRDAAPARDRTEGGLASKKKDRPRSS